MAKGNISKDKNTSRIKSMQDEETVGAAFEKLGKLQAKEIEEYRKKIREQNEKKLTQDAKKTVLDTITSERKSREELAKAEAVLRAELSKATIEEQIEYYKATTGQIMTKAQQDVLKAAKVLSAFGITSDDGKTLHTDNIKNSAVNKALNKAVDEAIDLYTSYQSAISTRLLGTAKSFSSIIDGSVKASPFYKTSDYIENVNDLVKQGIAQNVEQRAFLQTVSDKLVTTFDATNETLLRLARIQGTESTAARMGMEAYLNNFLNSTYQNTEYLTSLFDYTASYIEEATALLEADQSLATEYAVQKWLGALYAKGMSQSGITAIAQALGQLGSGNVNSLVGSGAGNLIAVASQGKLADYLKAGLTEATVNSVMQNIVDYLAELSRSGNNVVRAKVAEIFGVSISDLRAAANIETADIIGSVLSAESANKYLGNLMTTAADRVTGAEMIKNFTDNLSFAFGSQIADSKALYGIYKGADLLEQIVPSGIAIPTISVLGNSVDLKTSVADIMRITGMAGAAMGLIGDLLGGAQLTGDLLSAYNSLGSNKLSSSRGLGLGSRGSGTSQSAVTSNGGDIYENSLATADQNANTQKTKAAEQKTDDDIDVVVPNIYKYLIGTFDNKMDALIKLSSASAQYSVIDTIGNDLTASMNTIMSGNSVKITPKEETSKTADEISSNVASIYSLLAKVVNGEQSLAVRDISSGAGMALNAAALISAQLR